TASPTAAPATTPAAVYAGARSANSRLTASATPSPKTTPSSIISRDSTPPAANDGEAICGGVGGGALFGGVNWNSVARSASWVLTPSRTSDATSSTRLPTYASNSGSRRRVSAAAPSANSARTDVQRLRAKYVSCTL